MIRFGTLGTAKITPRALLSPCDDEPNAAVRAIAARDRARAEHFAEWAHIPIVLDDYAALVQCEHIDAVYNPLQITAHKDWSIRALEAGKHVLCEKAFAANTAEAEEMVAAAKKAGRVLMEADHYRYHTLFKRACEIYASGELGEIQHIEGIFSRPGERMKPDNIRQVYELGGGVTMDNGCYPISWVRHISGEEPTVLSAEAEVGPPKIDIYMNAKLQFPSGITAEITGDMRPGARQRLKLTVTGSRGQMIVVNPVTPQAGHRMIVIVDGEERNEYFDRRSTYAYQLDAFLNAVETGEEPITGGEDAIKQMKVIDACYEAAGLPLRGH